MKRLIMFIIMVFGYHNFLYANAPQTCGKNIKTGIIVCYDLKSYINSLKEKENEEKEESKLRLKELSVIAEKISYITTDINKISEQQEELYKTIQEKENL